MVIKYTHVANSILFSIISLFDLSVRLNLLNQFLSLKLLGFLIFVFFFSFKTLWKDCRLCNIISDTSDHSSHCALTSSRISTQRPVNLKSLYSRDLFFPPCSTVNEWCQPLHRKTNVVLLGEAFRR